MYFIPGQSAGNHFENAIDAYLQLKNSYIILLATLGNILSIAFFNFFGKTYEIDCNDKGVSITKYASATSRMVVDSIRTLVIWAFSLAVGWQKFQYLQVIGFTVMVAGTV